MTKTETTKKDSRPIVCGTDFSENALEAADVAAAMARKLGVDLVLVHVDEFRGLAMSDPGLFESAIAEKREELRTAADRLRQTETAVKEVFASGVVFEELIRVATELKARLLVVGAVGHSLARRLLVGSVSERVAETSHLPTLVVRPANPLLGWIVGEERLRVLAGYDFSTAGDAAVRWLGELAAIAPCDINITHIDWPPEQARRLGHHGPLGLHENPAQMQGFLERDLRERVALNISPETVSLSVVPGWGRVDAHLLQIAQTQKSGLIVLGGHQRHGLERLRLGSASRGILHHAQASVAVIPAPLDPAEMTVPKINRVLAATDFSDLGNEAVRYACAILRRGGTLNLVHVLAGEKPNPKLVAQLRRLVPASVARSLEIEAEVIEGRSAPEAIAQAAERCDADAICLGSHGRSGLAKTLLGSVAQGVMTASKRPIMVIRSRE